MDEKKSVENEMRNSVMEILWRNSRNFTNQGACENEVGSELPAWQPESDFSVRPVPLLHMEILTHNSPYRSGCKLSIIKDTEAVNKACKHY